MVDQTIPAQALTAKEPIFSNLSNLFGQKNPVSTNLWIYNREPLVSIISDMLFEALAHRPQLPSEFLLQTLLLEPAETVHAQKPSTALAVNIITAELGRPRVVWLPIGRDIPLQIPVLAQNELGPT